MYDLIYATKKTHGYFVEYGNLLILGKPNERFPVEPFLTAGTVYSMDSKSDDGIPDTGSIVTAEHSDIDDCHHVVDGYLEYDTENEELNCMMVIRTGL